MWRGLSLTALRGLDAPALHFLTFYQLELAHSVQRAQDRA